LIFEKQKGRERGIGSDDILKDFLLKIELVTRDLHDHGSPLQHQVENRKN
jgi:hypothetical protein